MIDATGNPAAGIAPRARVLRAPQAHRDGERGGRRARRAAARAPRARGGHRLFARLRRPAGAHLRAGGLGARRRLHRGRRGQGHQVPARLPRLHAAHGVGPLRLQRRDRWRKGDFNAQMFNSFLDGTKSGIEMAAVANATGLTPAPDGLAFPPCGVDDLPRVLRPARRGRQPAPRRAGRGGLEPRARRPAGVPRPALGRLRDLRRRARVRAPLLPASTASSPTPAASTRRCTSPRT